jgi:hypothetical protein
MAQNSHCNSLVGPISNMGSIGGLEYVMRVVWHDLWEVEVDEFTQIRYPRHPTQIYLKICGVT